MGAVEHEGRRAAMRPADAPLLELDGVSFVYEGADLPSLSDASIVVRRGEFIGVSGPSGSGKSTLASVIAGSIPHHFGGRMRGEAFVEGVETRLMSLTDIARAVGFVGQDVDAQMVASNVDDEMLFGLENFGVPHDEIPRRVAEALERTGAADVRGRELATLSGGQKQKVAVAAAVALRPRVLVLDEPTAALDPASSRAVFDVLRELNERDGVTVVVVERKTPLLAEFCDRMVVMDGGRIAADGDVREVLARGAELAALGVDRPRVASVSDRLRERGAALEAPVCLTAQEAFEALSHLMAGADGEPPCSREAAGGPSAEGVSPDRPDRMTPESRGARLPHGAGEGERVIEFEDVSFAYPGADAALSGLFLSVAAGECLAVVGANGAGKTTLTKLALGLIKPSRGAVRVAGLDTAKTRASVLARHASALFQNPDRQICCGTVLEEVAFNLVVRGVSKREANEIARSAIEALGLPEDADPFSLSRGRRQMVALASAMACGPRALVLDEPTSGLDGREREAVMSAVDGMRERGCAVLMVCHDMEVVSDFATRIAVMAGGRLLAVSPPSEAFLDAGLMEAARIEPPQLVELTNLLADAGFGEFEGLSEASAIADAAVRVCGPASSRRPQGFDSASLSVEGGLSCLAS